MTDRELLEAVVARTMTWNWRVWGFGEAVALRGLAAAGDVLSDPAPVAYVHGILRTWLGRGVARSAEDHVGAGRELVDFYKRTGDVRLIDGAHAMAKMHRGFAPGPHGARCHRADTPGWRHQIWVDCMDVDPPFLAALGDATGENRYFDQAAEECIGYARTLQADDGLFYHGFERDAGRNGMFWARGNGWALTGIIDTLVLLPRTHPHWQELADRLAALVTALGQVQHASGLWHTIVDDPDTYLESTLAAMAAYGLHEAFVGGILEAGEYGAVERKARSAMHSKIGADGRVALVSDATPVGSSSTYKTRPFGMFPWGQGPVLLALAQEHI